GGDPPLVPPHGIFQIKGRQKRRKGNRASKYEDAASHPEPDSMLPPAWNDEGVQEESVTEQPSQKEIRNRPTDQDTGYNGPLRQTFLPEDKSVERRKSKEESAVLPRPEGKAEEEKPEKILEPAFPVSEEVQPQEKPEEHHGVGESGRQIGVHNAESGEVNG